jgi:DNA-binding NarL/FixJ family response regulator
METQKTNLFIVDDNKLVVTTLKQYLQNKFGDALEISTFYDGDSCLAKVDKETHIVVLDYFMKDKNGLEVLKSIKAINPKTEVIILSSNEEIIPTLRLLREGAKDYVLKGEHGWQKVIGLVESMLTKPNKVIVKGFVK